MGWQDREYAHSESGYRGPGGMMGGGFMRPATTPVVRALLIANAVAFFLQLALQRWGIMEWLGAFVFRWAVLRGQLWRFVSYQYLHGGLWHIFFNMLALYFLGMLLEQRWGGRKFFILYTLFGVAGAGLYASLLGLGFITRDIPMIGASGSVLGLVGACAVAAPGVRVLLFFIIPVRIRTLAIAVAILYTLNVLNTQDGADACHLGGLGLGALWMWLEAKGLILWPSTADPTVSGPGRKWVQVKVRKGAWERKMNRQQEEQEEIDRILQKIHDKGLGSLSGREKKTLQQASKRES